MYACSPKWNADWINEKDVKNSLSQLSGRIKQSLLGPDKIDLNSGLHFTGGEPFLNFKLLLQATKIACELRIPSTFVETNCYWCGNDKVTEDKLRQLKDVGLKGVMVSVNPFILEYVSFGKTERAIRVSKKVFGENAIVYQSHFYRQFKKLGIESTLSLDDYIEKTGFESFNYVEMIPMGRFPYKLGHLFKKQKAESFFSQSCEARLTSPYHIYIDNYGNYITGFCGGISLGNADKLDLILDGIDLNERPVLRALVAGLGGLYNLGKEFGYEDLQEGYVSARHLCIDIRKHLVQKTDEFRELRPRELYSNL